MTDGTGFTAGRDTWLAGQGNLRNVVRQAVVSRQLAQHLPAAPAQVVDVGAGQGTQALALAARGYQVTAIEPDPAMRQVLNDALTLAPADLRSRVQVRQGTVTDLPDALGQQRFDVVCCHGVLMYLPESGPAVVELSDAVAPGGVLSLLVRNAAALALRPGLGQQWADVQDLLDAAEQPSPRYVNELGVPARADRLEEVAAYVAGRRMHVEAWYGVRVLTSGMAVDEPAPTDPDELAALLAAEERCGRTDPYRRLGALLHVVGRRPLPVPTDLG